MNTSTDRDSELLPSIDWLDAAAWPVPPADRIVLAKLRQKEAAGADLTPQERAQAIAIIRSARLHVRNVSSVTRQKTADERVAELDKRVGAMLTQLLKPS